MSLSNVGGRMRFEPSLSGFKAPCSAYAIIIKVLNSKTRKEEKVRLFMHDQNCHLLKWNFGINLPKRHSSSESKLSLKQYRTKHFFH